MSYIGNTPGVSSQRVVLEQTITGSPQSNFTPISGYTLGYVDVLLNGVEVDSADFTAADGVTVTLATPAQVGDTVKIKTWLPRGLSDGYLKSEADAKFAPLTAPTFTGSGGNVSINSSGDQIAFSKNGYNYITASGAAATLRVQASGASGQLSFVTGSTEAIHVDASQNVGIGTSSPSYLLHLNQNGNTQAWISATNAGSNSAGIGFENQGQRNWQIWADRTNDALQFGNNSRASVNMAISSSGNVGIGTSLPVAKLHVTSTGAYNGTVNSRTGLHLQTNVITGGFANTRIQFSYDTAVPKSYIEAGVYGADYLAFGNGSGSAEAMRIDSSGNLLVGKTIADNTSQVGHLLYPNGTYTVTTNVTSMNTFHFYNMNATYNGYRFYVNVNGGISNYSGNNVNLSDERTKTNIELAGGYLEKVCAIPVKLFNYKDEAEGEQRTLGVIAQDVEAVAPELVNQDGWLGEAPEGEAPLKSIYTTDMMFALMKSIQELNAKVEAQAAEIAVLKGGQQ